MGTEPGEAAGPLRRRGWLALLAMAIGLIGAGTGWRVWSRPATPVPPDLTPRPGDLDGHAAVRVGFIGDSITEGYGSDRPPSESFRDALADLPGGVAVVNRAVGGSSTADWLPGRRTFDEAERAFERAKVRYVVVTLGINDARGHRPAAEFRANLAAIVAALTKAGDRVVLNLPPAHEPGRSSRWADAETLALLRSYLPEIRSLTDGRGVLLGDTAAFDYFRDHPELLRDGVHPGPAGAAFLGRRWAAAFRAVLDRERDDRAAGKGGGRDGEGHENP
ncbi:MAG TPA: SGNH/GDSL hydrolase family protein [Isosphaeraceae bacterium]|jgi:lysophospholipase L1-like esterase|nr:SGNH/GDSL hydrolase family protein [Isosphaeraceae bacterium]